MKNLAVVLTLLLANSVSASAFTPHQEEAIQLGMAIGDLATDATDAQKMQFLESQGVKAISEAPADFESYYKRRKAEFESDLKREKTEGRYALYDENSDEVNLIQRFDVSGLKLNCLFRALAYIYAPLREIDGIAKTRDQFVNIILAGMKEAYEAKGNRKPIDLLSYAATGDTVFGEWHKRYNGNHTPIKRDFIAFIKDTEVNNGLMVVDPNVYQYSDKNGNMTTSTIGGAKSSGLPACVGELAGWNIRIWTHQAGLTSLAYHHITDGATDTLNLMRMDGHFSILALEGQEHLIPELTDYERSNWHVSYKRPKGPSS